MLCRPLRALREVWLVGSRWLCCLVAYVREVCLVGYVRQRRMQAGSFLVCVASFLVCVASLASRLLPRLPPRLLRLASLSPYMPAYVPTSAAMPLCLYVSMSLCLCMSLCLYAMPTYLYASILHPLNPKPLCL